MKILVVGGAGFIGKPVVKGLQENHQVESWDMPNVDIARPETYRHKLAQLKPDLVVNLAAVLGDMHSTNIKEISDVNYVGNLQLVEVCAQLQINHFVFASSLTVHGENEPQYPSQLDSPFAPKHPYSAAKAAAEYTLMQYARLRNMVVTAVRPVSIIGDTDMNHAPIDFVTTLLAGKPIEIYGSGEHEREWLWIDDVVTGFESAVKYASQQASGYHPLFLGGNRISMKDLAQAAVHLVGGSIVHVSSTKQAFTLTCDMSETQQMLNWQPSLGIDQIVNNVADMHQHKDAAEYAPH